MLNCITATNRPLTTQAQLDGAEYGVQALGGTAVYHSLMDAAQDVEEEVGNEE